MAEGDLPDNFIERFAALFSRQNREDNTNEELPRREPVIELSLKGVADKIRDIAKGDDAGKIVVMTGAGISTAAGIPDFRTPGTGLYDNLQKYNLPSPQSVFEIGYLKENPKPFFLLAKELYPGRFKPTMSHYFIRLLADKGLLLRNYTQNIDTLERRSGVDPELLVEAHGNFIDAHCVECCREFPHEFVKEHIFAEKVPKCDCEGIIKPDIVFFGESLPERFFRLMKKDMKEADMLIVMGTSLLVQPFASLVDLVREDCPRLLINREKAGEKKFDLMALLSGGGASGFDFSEKTGYRDVFYQGDCDTGVLELARLIGWEENLTELYKGEHARLDSEMDKEMSKFLQNEEGKDKDQKKPQEKSGDTQKTSSAL